MSHEASDESDLGAEPDTIRSVQDCAEIALLNHWFTLVDPRPDPGFYRNADADGAARDMVELNILISFADPRPFTRSWVKYVLEEDLFDQP
jgi:hypothetical protein